VETKCIEKRELNAADFSIQIHALEYTHYTNPACL